MSEIEKFVEDLLAWPNPKAREGDSHMHFLARHVAHSKVLNALFCSNSPDHQIWAHLILNEFPDYDRHSVLNKHAVLSDVILGQQPNIINTLANIPPGKRPEITIPKEPAHTPESRRSTVLSIFDVCTFPGRMQLAENINPAICIAVEEQRQNPAEGVTKCLSVEVIERCLFDVFSSIKNPLKDKSFDDHRYDRLKIAPSHAADGYASARDLVATYLNVINIGYAKMLIDPLINASSYKHIFTSPTLEYPNIFYHIIKHPSAWRHFPTLFGRLSDTDQLKVLKSNLEPGKSSLFHLLAETEIPIDHPNDHPDALAIARICLEGFRGEDLKQEQSDHPLKFPDVIAVFSDLDEYGFTPYNLAANNANKAMAALFKQHGANSRGQFYYNIVRRIHSHRLEIDELFGGLGIPVLGTIMYQFVDNLKQGHAPSPEEFYLAGGALVAACTHYALHAGIPRLAHALHLHENEAAQHTQMKSGPVRRFTRFMMKHTEHTTHETHTAPPVRPLIKSR